ncbi:MAG: hypothetical protein VB050_12815 [Geobacteraceae bacterium]|nr:hypothetical protein [Geobacteraceae bacterium]
MERNRFSSSAKVTPYAPPGMIGQVKDKAVKRAGGVMLAVLAAGLFSVSGAQAALTYSGNLNPADPSAWTTSTSARVGDTANGTLSVDGGSTVSSSSSYLGYAAAVTGTASVTGTGSSWASGSTRYVGYNGAGVLNITNGATASNTTAYIGYNTGSSGAVTVDGSGSSWTSGALNVGRNGTGTLNIFNGSTVSATGATTVGTSGTINFGNNGGTLSTSGLSASASQISGIGTINTSGIVSDIALVFDGSHGASQTFSFNGIAVNLSQSSSGVLGVGYLGSGTLTIADGVGVASNGGYLGYQSGSTGSAIISGSGSNWTNSGSLYVGNSGAGMLSITNGATVSNRGGSIGYNAGSTGTATVSGPSSTWANATLNVGYNGTGTLNITNGGTVTATSSRLGSGAGVTGTMNISGAGSKLTVTGTSEIGYMGNGVVSVSNGGTLVTAGLTRIGFNGTSNSSLTVDGAGSSWSSGGSSLYVGTDGIGTLNITNGGTVTTTVTGISIADNYSSGTINVSGPGSTWNATCTGGFYISRLGTSKLNITNGGKVVSSSATLNLGYYGSGTAVVSGPGSSWNHTGVITMGAAGRLFIGDGGAVTASGLVINTPSLVTTDIDRGSSLTISSGSGTITNNGTIRLVASAGAANGVYTPITYGTMSGTGSVQALGGIWDATNHTVTVTSAAAGAAGSALTADLATTQRFLFTDGSTGKSVGAGFQAATSPTNLTLTASSISGSELTSLQSLLGTGQAVLSGWDFSATEGYTEGNPVYLSLFAGTGHSLYNLTVWHYDGSAWSKFDASDLAYDKSFASFTATGLSGYAVSGTAPVPIPPAVFLFGSGLSGLFFFRRRKSQA